MLAKAGAQIELVKLHKRPIAAILNRCFVTPKRAFLELQNGGCNLLARTVLSAFLVMSRRAERNFQLKTGCDNSCRAPSLETSFFVALL